MTNTSTPGPEPIKTSIAPWLSVSRAAEAVSYYQAAFGAVERYRLEDDKGSVIVAQLSIEGADFWLQEDSDSSPESLDRQSVRMILTVDDPDTSFEQAINAGATEVAAISEEHGWRIGRIVDPFGYHWEIGRPLQGTDEEKKEMTDDNTTEKSVDLRALSDLCTPWCIHVIATLHIADHIAAGDTSITALARKAECDSDFLQRVLRYLVGKGIFQEPTPGQFTLNAAARGLLNPALQLGLDLSGIGGRMAYAWGSLLSAVRTGAPAYQEVFGLPFWEDLEAHPDVAASFDALMGPQGHGTPDPEVLVTGDWEKIKTVVDVGGGTGALLAEILRAHPQIQGTLVDLPRTIARAEMLLQEAGVSERVKMVGQSFFDPLPAGANLYLLKEILHDWPDREAKLILSRCAEAARPGGHVVILGGVTPEDQADPELLMLVLLGSKNRTLTEFDGLARQAGLKVQASGKLPSGRFAVECRPM